MHIVGQDALIAENFSALARVQIDEIGDRGDFLVPGVAQLTAGLGDQVLFVVRQLELNDPVGIVGEPGDFLILDGKFEEANRGGVRGIVNNIGIVFPFLGLAFVQRWVFFRTEQDGVVIEPFDLLDSAFEFGDGPGRTSGGVHQPELHVGVFRLWFGQRLAAQESDRFAGRRPARLRDVVSAASELDLLAVGKIGNEKITDAFVFIFISSTLNPHCGFAVRGDFKLAGIFLVDDVFGSPRRFFFRGRCRS